MLWHPPVGHCPYTGQGHEVQISRPCLPSRTLARNQLTTSCCNCHTYKVVLHVWLCLVKWYTLHAYFTLCCLALHIVSSRSFEVGHKNWGYGPADKAFSFQNTTEVLKGLKFYFHQHTICQKQWKDLIDCTKNTTPQELNYWTNIADCLLWNYWTNIADSLLGFFFNELQRPAHIVSSGRN